jgi:molecular chaperone DnaK (HSP70)
LNDDDVKPHIRSILQTNEDHMYFQEMMKRLNEAMKVIDLCDDVTKDEYDLMLEEIAEIVNPFISQIQKIVKREKIT